MIFTNDQVRVYSTLLSCLLILWVLPVSADPTTQVRRLIQAAYDKQDIAYDHGDVNGVTAFFAPNWTVGDSDYKVMLHRNEGRDLLENMGAFEKEPFSVVQKITDLHLHGNQAVATVEERTTIGPSTNQYGTTPQHVYTGINTDTWEHTRKGWLMTRSFMASGHFK